LIFLAIVVAIILWMRRLPGMRTETDVEKWKARPRLNTHAGVFSKLVVGDHGAIPCFFLVPKTAANQPAASGTIGDCLELVPNGRKLDLFEVDLWTGDLLPIVTDDYVFGAMPLAFTRVVYPIDDWARRFHVFLRHVYDPYMTGSRFPYTYVDWLLPDDMHIYYRRVSHGTGYADAIFESKGFFSVFGWSRISWNGFGWDVALQNGTTYLSPEAYYAKRPQQGSLVGIFDRTGNEVRLSRKHNGDLAEIDAPGGQFIKLAYDGRERVTHINDSAKNFVQYDYDSEDRLVSASYLDGRRVTYVYNGANRVVEARDSAGISDLKIEYDSQDRVARMTLADGRTYSFRYGPAERGMNSWAELEGPKSQTVRIALSGTSYSIQQVNSATEYIDRRPIDGSMVGRTYTNKFFDFSIKLPENWIVLAADQVAGQNTKAVAYALLAAGSRDKQMHGTRWIVVAASRPRGSTLSQKSALNLAEQEASGLNFMTSMGLAKGFQPIGKPSEVLLGGTRMARLHLAAEVDVGDASYDTRISQLTLVERGYLLMFISSDSLGGESDAESAAKALNSLRFYGQPH
jgi:YD repeat-containing protein